MNPLELRAYMTKRGRVALRDLALRFDSDPNAIRGMLEHFIRKGRVRRLETRGACGGCEKCDSTALEIYEWIGDVQQATDRAAAPCQAARPSPLS